MEANVEVVGDHQPQDEAARRVVVFDAAPDEIAAKMAAMPPDVLLEPEILHFPQVSIPRPGALPDVAHAQLLDAGVGIAMTVWARGGGSPVVGARGILYLRGPLGRATSQEAQADASGRLRFDFGAPYTPSALLIIPPGGFWSFVVRGPEDGLVVDLPALPRSGPLAWWHQAAGITSSDATADGASTSGSSTRRGPHPYLGHVARAGAFIDGRVRVDAAATDDVDSHGTHVCATIGARPRSGTGDYEGLAPGATLSCARVFPPGQGASQADIVLAIDISHATGRRPHQYEPGFGSRVADRAGLYPRCAGARDAVPVRRRQR
jgi:subtilisin family serine protease